MAQLLAAPYSYFADSNGAPLSGGFVYTYAAGTNTPQATYTDSSGTTPLANPVVLDSAGRAAIWLVGTYRIVVQDSLGNTIRTVDNVGIVGDMSKAVYDPAGVNEQLVGLTAIQTVSNKAFVTPTRTTTPTANTASSQLADMYAVQQSQNGGYINRFRNATMDIASRGINNITLPVGTNYTLDGWIAVTTGAATAFYQGNLGSNSVNTLLITSAVGLTGLLVKQRIESYDARVLAGQTVTIQAQIFHTLAAAFTPVLTVKCATAVDNWASTTTDVSAVSLQSCPTGASTIVAYTYTASGANGVNGIEVSLDMGSNFNVASKQLQIGRLDIRITPGATIGLNASPPVAERRSIAAENVYSRRYLPARLSTSTADVIASGMCITTTTGKIVVPFDTPTRVAPNGIAISAAGDFSVRKSDGTLQVCTALTFVAASTYAVELGFTVGSAVLTAGNATELLFTSATGTLLVTGAEL